FYLCLFLRPRTSYLIFSSFFSRYPHHRDLHSFPTRRSSDLDVHADLLGLAGMARRGALVDHAHAGRLQGRQVLARVVAGGLDDLDRKSTRLNSSHVKISYAVFCLKKKKYVNRAAEDV